MALNAIEQIGLQTIQFQEVSMEVNDASGLAKGGHATLQIKIDPFLEKDRLCFNVSLSAEFRAKGGEDDNAKARITGLAVYNANRPITEEEVEGLKALEMHERLRLTRPFLFTIEPVFIGKLRSLIQDAGVPLPQLPLQMQSMSYSNGTLSLSPEE